MKSEPHPVVVPEGLSLRDELNLRARLWARAHGYTAAEIGGEASSLLFGCDEAGRHGNFHPEVYAAILRNTGWMKRLGKVHTAYKRSRARADWPWRELDAGTSSDALLMNVFCHPQTRRNIALHTLLGESAGLGTEPVFGVKPRTPLASGRSDTTEMDMRLGDLLVEAKLTEADFQTAPETLIQRYQEIEEVFDSAYLPRLADGRVSGYQLIRGTLAAHATGLGFAVLCDARRPNLVEIWFQVQRCVRPLELRMRLKLLTWQEVAATLGDEHRSFLAARYGIFPSSGSSGISGVSQPGTGQ
ncbi:PGN_0703 family putative restriction endonuclease [Silvibacterium sp.]|uniref:PGN_0703 family putative restriction endonuclease n=1 Tax=Silvibacterium sp. TaxID=1964179 RepID=UPI0039E68CED